MLFSPRKFAAAAAALGFVAFGASSAMADTVTLHGSAKVVTAAGSPSGKAIQIQSGPSTYGSAQYNYADSRDIKFGQYSSMSVSYNVLDGAFAGGSPRIGFGLNIDGDKDFNQAAGGDNYAFIYLDQLTGFTDGAWLNTGNLFSSGVQFDLSHVGGVENDDVATAKSLLSGYRIDHIVLAVDGGWSTDQNFQFDNLKVNGTTAPLYDLVVVPTPSAALAGFGLMGVTALRRRRSL